MKNWIRRKTTYFAAAGVIVVAAIVRGPRPFSNVGLDVVLGLLVLVAVIVIGVYRFASVAAMREFDAWRARLDDLGTTFDVRADETLHELLTESQWEAVFDKLSGMPEDQRSLREAIVEVAPDALG